MFKLKSYGIDSTLLKSMETRSPKECFFKWLAFFMEKYIGLGSSGFFVGTPSILSYINDLTNGIKLICKISVDCTLLFSKFKENSPRGGGEVLGARKHFS